MHGRFSKFHIPFIFILIIFVLERYFSKSAPDAIYSLWVLFPILALEFAGKKTLFFNEYKFLYLLRYVELAFSAFVFSVTNYKYFLVISILIYFILFIELTTLYDFSDYYYRSICVIMGFLPALISIAFTTFLHGTVDSILFIKLGIVLSITIVLVFLAMELERFKTCLEEKLLMQNRLLNTVNETNEALKIHQEKVKRANEELSYQKVMLETAYKRINRSNKEITLQNQILKYISSSIELNNLMNLITDALIKELELNICAISLNPNVVNNKKVLYQIKTTFNKEYECNLASLIEHNCFNSYIQAGKTYIDNQVNNNQYDFINSSQIGSILITPLLREGIQIGFLYAGSSKYDGFLDNEEFYQAIVAQILIALKNANMYALMESMAVKDALTGVYNRGHLANLFPQFVEESINNGKPITVALLDIDKFKTINDTYGHIFGDSIIKTIASIADEKANATGGLVFRYGGEEFVLVYPEKDLLTVYEHIKELRDSIKDKENLHNNEVIHVNVSIGITSYPETCKNPNDLLNRADWSMYYSKQNGRDRITIDSDEVREKVLMK